jgi:biopolymer transport protein TolR
VAISTSSQSAVSADINVTPMADVMLVLLIIFMITAPLIASGFQAQMPQGVNLISQAEQPDDIVLGMDKDGNYYINTRPIAKDQVTAKLTEIYSTIHTLDRILYFKADVNLRMDKVQEAIKMARDAGVAVVAAITEQKLGTEPTVPQERGH